MVTISVTRLLRRCLVVPIGLITAAAVFTLPARADEAAPPAAIAVLNEHCIHCHGPDTQEGGLRLDTAVAALRGGDSGEPTIVPGHSQRSYLMVRVTNEDPDRRMPPDSEPLSEQQLDHLRSWIDAAGAWQQAADELAGRKLTHWAFQPVTRPVVPVDGETNPIDAFISDRLARSDLQMSSAASRRRLIRRLFLVMHGLPPTPERVERFVEDTRPDAWEQLVDEVLDSHHYGERWATFWLDLVRFAETDGFETNRERPHAWYYRDWVIQSLNEDKPYDAFVREQLAGDVLGADVATGFLVAGPHDIVKGQDKQLGLMQRQDELDGIINATGATFLGLTLGCARCHNHKFDPVMQQDYYALQAVFAGVNYDNRPLPPSPEQQRQRHSVAQQVGDLRDSLLHAVAPSDTPLLLLDDRSPQTLLSPGVEFLVEPAGEQQNAEDEDQTDTPRQVASRHPFTHTSTLWTPKHDTRIAVWRPFSPGKFRIWLSWGAGAESACEDASYWLDHDGNPQTSEDRTLLARINQRTSADGEDRRGQPVWSGFHNAGVHTLSGNSTILLRSGRTGTTLTADAVLLESLDHTGHSADPSAPPIRPPVNSKLNVESFAPVSAGFVRFAIDRSSSQPCLDELEVYSGETNVALASTGVRATSSGDFVHPLHRLEHINDGKHGNAHSWIASTPDNAWVQLELPQPVSIDRIVWSRDRQGRYTDRLPLDYRIEISLNGTDWQTVAASTDRLPASFRPQPVTFDESQLPAEEAEAVAAQITRLNELLARHSELTQPRRIWAGRFETPGPTWRLYRGDPMMPREQVVPGAVAALTSLQLPADSPEQQRRLALADWITDPQNPLTARVMVNRIWQHHFGTGFVDTPSDFGQNGTRPTHPRLLDWLAAEFVERQWSLKHLHRLLLTSRTWQQDSQPHPNALSIDAGSRLLWRFPPRRLEAEAIRDSVLAVTGRLNPAAGGPGFSAFEVAMENVRHYFPRKSFGEEEWRRMVYMTKVRQERDAVFGTFDCPDCSQLVPARSRSTTPLQAMGLLNSSFMLQQSRFFADRLQKDAEDTDGQITRAWQLCFARPPDDDEITLARQAIADFGLPGFARAVLNANEFVFIP